MYLLGPMNSYATGKIARLFVRGITWMFMFQIYVQSKEVENIHFSILLGLLAVFYLSQAYLLYDIRPGGMFDVSFFRDIGQGLEARSNDNIWANTHTLGYLAAGAMIFMIMKEDLTLKSIVPIILIFILMIITIISGARQTMLVCPLLIALKIVLKDNHYVRNGLVAIISMCTLLFIVFFSGSSSVQKTVSGTNVGESLNRDVHMPFEIIQINPVFGVGFGGYADYADKTYPHNLFLEIMAEFGIIGSAIIMFISIIAFCISKISLRYMTYNGSYFVLFFVMFFFKAMISGDLSSNVVLFAIILSFVKVRYSILRY